ncbi:MAG: nucleotidyltransferase family protein [Candidatus Omnitrophota bacterium]
MKVLILAAGYATRLYPLTKEYPKPLLKVGNRPLIDYLLDKCTQIKDCDEIIVVTNSKFFSKFKKWAKGLNFKTRISLVDDLTKTHSARRGAIGDMYFVIQKKRLKDDLLVIGGDNLFDGGLGGFLDFVRVRKSNSIVIGAYNLRDKKEASKYGVIKLDKNNKVIDFKEKPKNPNSAIVAMCLYFFPKKKLGLLDEYLSNKDNLADATGFYIDWLRKREIILGYIFGGRWFDIGDTNFYNKAKETFAKRGG